MLLRKAYEKSKNLKARGALTVEACISLPVFLFFLLFLLFIIRVACISMTLNHAVNETAKQLATLCYPVSFLNELEDEQIGEGLKYTIPTFEEEKAKISEYINSSDLVTMLISGEMNESGAQSVINSVVDGIGGDVKNGIRGFLVKQFAGKYYETKTKAKYSAAKFLLDKFCQGSFVEKDKIEFSLVELPESNAEFYYKSKFGDYSGVYEEVGYTDPDPGNVVIAVEYKIKVPFWFFGIRDITTRHIAVERAWLHGSNGVYTVDSGGGDEESDDNEIVYITNTGECYHRSFCMHLQSKIPIKLSDAKSKGYRPCKRCITKDAGLWHY